MGHPRDIDRPWRWLAQHHTVGVSDGHHWGCQEAIEPDQLSIIDEQMKCPDSSESGKVSGGFHQPGTVLLAGLTGSLGFWMWLDVSHR